MEILWCGPTRNTSKLSIELRRKSKCLHINYTAKHGSPSPGLSCMRPTLAFCAVAIPLPTPTPPPSDFSASAEIFQRASSYSSGRSSLCPDPLLGSTNHSCDCTFINICVSLLASVPPWSVSSMRLRDCVCLVLCVCLYFFNSSFLLLDPD